MLALVLSILTAATDGSPHALLQELQTVEKNLGRTIAHGVETLRRGTPSSLVDAGQKEDPIVLKERLELHAAQPTSVNDINDDMAKLAAYQTSAAQEIPEYIDSQIAELAEQVASGQIGNKDKYMDLSSKLVQKAQQIREE